MKEPFKFENVYMPCMHEHTSLYLEILILVNT